MVKQWPVLGMRHNIFWTAQGSAWAIWRLRGLAYGHGRAQEKTKVKDLHKALYQSLLGEWMLLGMTNDLDPATVAEAMIDGVDLAAHPGWVQEVEATLTELELAPPGTRTYWLAAPLHGRGIPTTIRALTRAADARIRLQLSLPSRVPAWREFEELLADAHRIYRAIPGTFDPTPATKAELLWLNDHLQQRGLGLDAPLPPATDPTTPPAPGWQSGADLANPWIDEGAQSDQDTLQQRLTPFRRRYLKVEHTSGTISYQQLLAITGTPPDGFAFPGGEFLAALEDLPVDADFAVRMLTTPAERVKTRNKRAETRLVDQYDQQDTGLHSITGGRSELDASAQALADYSQALSHGDWEVEVQPTMIIAVGAATLEDLSLKSQYLQDHYKAHDWTLAAPLGGQEDLWWSMVPGIPRCLLVTELAQITTGSEFAMGVPLVNSELGERTGFHIADNITTGRRTPVLMSPGGSAQLDTSGSFAVTGEKGSGKSTLMKTVASHVFDRGGKLVIIDRSDNMEWAHFGRTLDAGRTAILDLITPVASLDPLRVFDPHIATRMTQSLFTVLFSIPAMSPEGAVLSRFVHHDYARAHGITSLRVLRERLEAADDPQLTAGQREVCAALAAKIGVIAHTDFGRVLFDDTLAPLDLGSQAIVFCTHGLDLPRTAELMHESLKAELRLEKVFGRAMYSLMAAIGRAICFADDTQEAGFLVDEAHHMTGASPEAQAEIADFLRYDRKHKAFLGLGSHEAEPDFGPPELRALIPQRFVFRHRDVDSARKNLDWFAKYDQQEWIEKVTRDLSPLTQDGVAVHRRGEALMRDARNRIGAIRVLLPRHPARRAAVLSTPGMITRAGQVTDG